MTSLLIGTTGSRHHEDADLIGTSLYRLIDDLSRGLAVTDITLRHGACPGGADQIVADFCASEADWFERGGITLIEDPVPADWDSCGPDCPPRPHRRRKPPGDQFHPGRLPDYCPGAGPRRNASMLTPDVAVLAAFPLGASYGTRNCMRLARAAGIRVRTFPPITKREAS